MNQNRVINLYRFSLFMLIVSGFAQMPIFKRYYIADIPGLGWLAQFYVTHILHYSFAALFLFLIFYIAVLYLGDKERKSSEKKIKSSTIFKTVIYSILIVSGFILVLRNYPGYKFSDLFNTITIFVHMAFVMIFLFLSPLFMILKK